MTALSMTVLLSIAALSIDASYMYDKRNKLYAAADGAAKSVAIEMYRGGSGCLSSSVQQVFANQAVAAHGFDPLGTTTVTPTCPPSSGPFAGNNAFVEVVVSEQTATFFGRILGWVNLTPGARAVAGTNHGNACLITLGPPGTPTSLSLAGATGGGTATINAPGCTISDAGDMDNQASITAAGIGVTGDCSGNCAGVTQTPPPTDPFATLPAPSAPIPTPTCTGPWTVPSGSVVITSADVNDYYCGFSFDSHSGDLTINAVSGAQAIYINGPVDAATGGSNAHLTVNRMMVYISPTGSFDVSKSNDVVLNLSAPTSGTWKAIAFYQDRTNATKASFGKNNGSLTLDGVIYIPDALVEMKNNGPASDCDLILVKQLATGNNINYDMSSGCSAFGGSPILTIAMAE